ncbi:gag-pol polyprotein [Cucumis melo var. makuwa]|uniref:Gag-pol polyprotein n=1 Tax=Cucumis melo var. makuwa TaxID=1194695 RepID=A0A5A7VF43_CUCMM|nr:gag-pol polyprotein [Cucumis melo var. makuwa]TYK04107.1 gag-pol polyprotein [Cucumis melo var. makuwa]
MEIIREGPSTSRPSILDGKNYSYWKPQMIFFIKTLDGKAWRALVAGYDPPIITVNGVSVPKPEVDWTDAEEQDSVGNAIHLIKFDVKVTVIEEAHDIMTLKLDELFGSLLTFEMATADRESKKGKGIAFRSTHVGEEAISDTENENDQILKFVKMLNLGTENLDSILKSGHNGSHRHGLGFVASASRLKATSEIKFVPASTGVEHERFIQRLASGLLLNLLGERVTIVVGKAISCQFVLN